MEGLKMAVESIVTGGEQIELLIDKCHNCDGAWEDTGIYTFITKEGTIDKRVIKITVDENVFDEVFDTVVAEFANDEGGYDITPDFYIRLAELLENRG